MQISVVSGTSVRLFDRTIGQDSFFDGASSKVSLVDTGSCLLVSCLGPASANLSFTSVHLLPGDSENFSVVGQLGLVQLEYFRVPKFVATLRNGLLDVRYPQVSAAMLDVGGAAVSLRIGRESSVRLLLTQSSELTAGTAIDSTCLSDVAGVPTWNETAGDVSLGDDPNPPEFRILRGAGGRLGALFASRGVLQHERMAEVNTRDSMGTAGFQAESDFTVWASQRAKAGAQVLRLRVVAPGFDDDLGSISAKSEWLYSAFGNVYIWHPLSAFYLTTLSIFTPIVSRTDVVLKSTQCTPRVALVSPGDSCMPDSARYGSYGTDALGGTHMALGQALPEVLSFSNRTASRIYQLRSATTVAPFLPSIADAVVSEFQYSGQSGVNSMMTLNSVGDRGNFMDFRSQAFAAIAVIVCLVLPFFITILGYRFYQTEKAKILAADGWRIWPILWQAKQKAMEEVAHFVAEAEAEPTEASEAGRAPEQLEAGAPKKRKGPLGSIEASKPEAMRENLLSILAKFASESITSVADGVQEVVDQVVDFEMSEAEKDLHSRAEGLLGRSANLLTFVECVVFRRVGSLSFYSDGLVYASLLVILHFGILQALMVPAAAIFLVNSYNITDYQGVYFLSSLLLGELNSSYPLSQAGWIIILTTEVFMLFYTIVEYLCRHIDQVILTQTQLAAGRLSVHRRRLLNLRASRLFRDNMFFLLLIFLHIGITLGIAFSLYLLLGACVTPETVAPVLIGLIATIYVGRRTAELVFSSSRSLQAQLMNSVSDMQSDASTVGEALEETLTELGLNDAQVLLFSLVITGTFACAVAFVLLGSSLFITADSIAPALISGLATVTGALAAARGGAGAEDTLLKFEALKNFNAKVQEVQKFSQQANDAAQAAKDATKQAVEGAEAAKTTVTTPTTPIAGLGWGVFSELTAISNMRRCTAHLRDLTLLRGTTSAVLLNSFGHVMKSTTGGTGTVSEGENDYDKSYVVSELDIFLSHSWHACWWQKYLTLLYYFNALPATISAVAAGLMWCALQYRIGCVGVLSWRGFFPSSILFFIVLFSWHHVRALLESYRISIFLDKVCIHQKDEQRKTQGINAIGGILNKSRTLLVAWDRTYFSRLWCSFELAAFYHSKLYDSKAAGKVVLLPIILGKVISEIAACTWALELLRIHMPFNAGLRSAALLLVSLAFATRFYDFLIESNGLKAELAEFSAQNAQCFCCSNRHLNPITGEKLSCDRALVNASIAHWYGDDDVTEGLATFNELIRGRFREEVGEAVRGARMPFHFVLVASVWPAMHQLDYITMSE
ncbi:cobB, partial [Symbiodinium necroappetens]